MIKAATDGAREFGSARIKIVLTLSAEAANIVRLVAIAWFAPILISLGARGSNFCVISMSVISTTCLAFTSIVSRRGVGIIQLLKGLCLVGRHWLYEINTGVWHMSYGGPLQIWKWIVGVVRGSMVIFPLLVDGSHFIGSSRSVYRW